ncbi:MAG: hypothetical protein AAGE03_07775 [Pseudomonadota bacterium]
MRLCAIASAVALATVGQPVLADLTLPMLGKGRAVKVSAVALSDDARAEFERFATGAEPFAAMYVTSDGWSWGWQSGTFAAKDAKRMARILCESTSDLPCVLYARIVPMAGDATRGVPSSARDDIERGLQETGTGRHMAIAANGIGTYGYSFDYATAAQAEARALAECESWATTDRTNTDYTSVNSAITAAGLYDCRLMDSFAR